MAEAVRANAADRTHVLQSKLNCEVLWDENAFEVRWAVAGDSVVIQLVGKIDDGEYMSFGLSGSDTRSRMVGGDVAVVWVNHSSLAGDAQDYFLEGKAQCAGVGGSCPDWRIREGTNSIRLLNAAMVNGYSIVTYQRPLHAKDELDHAILTNGSQPVIWALGPLNSRNEVSYHRVANRHDVFIDFARSPKWNCPIPDAEGGSATTAADVPSSTAAPVAVTTRGRRPSTATQDAAASAVTTSADERSTARRPSSRQPAASRAPATPAPAPTANAWDIPAIQCYEPEDGVFYAQMGPTGGKRGYSAITGHVGWGISWYINGLLIPEINVVRGKTYTFVVEGGNDPETPARYHPFYITDDPVGGYQYKTTEEKNQVSVFAGVRVNRRGEAYPTGTGRLCNWTPDQTQPPADEFASFGAYQRTLTLECDQGEAGVVQWTPDENTPDTVYYQCYTHRYLGWRINVHDSCDASALSASEPVTTRVPAGGLAAADDSADDDDRDGELQSRPSIRVATRVKPDGAVYGDKESAKPTFAFTSPDGPYSLPGPNQVDKPNLGEVYLPPAALQQEAQPYSPPGQQYIPLTDESDKDGYDGSFTVQPSSGADYANNATSAVSGALTEFSVRPSPVDYINPGNGQVQQATSVQPSAEPYTGDASYTADHLRHPIAYSTTPHSILLTNASKTTDVKLLSSTATPTQSAENDHTLLDADLNGLKSTSEPTTTIINSPPFLYKRPVVHRPHGLAPHGYILPNGRPAGLGNHMVIHRPQAYNIGPFRRPIPHRGYVPLHRPAASIIRPTYISTPHPHNYLVTSKKPFYRVTMMGVPHRTMVSPPPFHRPVTTIAARPIIPTQQQYPSSYKNVYSLPPQRIKYDKLQAIGSTSNSPASKPDGKNANEQKKAETSKTTPIVPSAQLLSTSTESVGVNLPIAINTGFRPESVVVEGGFKPIIHKNVAQDRSSVESDTEFVDQDEIVEKLEKEIVDELAEKIDVQEDRKENPFEGQQPETFEPMFIPSPPDRINQRNASDSKVTLGDSVGITEDLIPPAVNAQKNGAAASRSPLVQKITSRPRPSAAKRPNYSGNVAAPLRIPLRSGSPSFRYQQGNEDTSGEMAMAAERMDTYYLPPVGYPAELPSKKSSGPPNVDQTIPPGAVVAYDGKSVLDVSLASSISDPSASTASNYQSSSGTAELIRGTPQFGPYRGEVPPPVPNVVHPETIPQLQSRNKQQSKVLPAHFNQRTHFHNPSTASTRLSIVDETSNRDLLPAGSEIKELFSVYESKQKDNGARDKQHVKKTYASDVSQENSEESTTSDRFYSTVSLNNEETTIDHNIEDVTTINNHEKQRWKREASPHHEPGHTGTGDDHDHDHSQHGHDHPDHHHQPGHDHEHSHDHSPKSGSQSQRNNSTGKGSQNSAAQYLPATLMLNLCVIFQIVRHIS